MSPDSVGPGQAAAESSELERLRRENEELRLRTGAKVSGWRAFWAGLLIVLACIATLGAVLATWTHWTLLNTSRFVNTVAPLVQEKEVQAAVSQEAVHRLFEQYGLKDRIQKELEKGLPEALQFTADPAASNAEGLAKLLTTEIVKSDTFQTGWRSSLSFTHSEALKGIRAEGTVRLNQQGEVVLDITSVLGELKDKLAGIGLNFLKNVKIPEDIGQVVLYRNAQLGNVKTAVNALDILFWVLPWAAVLMLIGGVAMANDRRRALIAASVGIIIVMVLLLAALAIVRPHYLDQIKNSTDRSAAMAIASHVQGGLNAVDAGLIVMGALMLFAAVLSGPYGWATRLHRAVSIPEHMRSKNARAGVEASPAWTTRYSWLMRLLGLCAAVLLLLYLPQASAAVVIAVSILYGVYLVAVEMSS